MRLCCLDQSTKKTGYSIWDGNKLVRYGSICVPSDLGTFERMCLMYEEVKKMLEKERPSYVCVEDTHYQNNANVLKRLSQMQGLIFAILIEMDIGFCTIESSSWKSYIGLKARKREEQKKETIEFVKNKYDIDKLTDDEADSIAIGHWATNNLIVK